MLMYFNILNVSISLFKYLLYKVERYLSHFLLVMSINRANLFFIFQADSYLVVGFISIQKVFSLRME